MSSESKNIVIAQPQSVTKDDIGEVGLHESRDSSQGAFDTEAGQTALRPGENSVVGLKVLEKLNSLEVVQRLDMLEVCLGWTRNNRYCIFNEEGEQIFYVYEASVCFHRQLTGAYRGLALKVSLSDEDQEDVLLLQRPGACSSRCCWICCNLQHMKVALSSGPVLANVREIWNCCIPEYHVSDSEGGRLWKVRGGVCHCRCCCQLEFQYLSPDGEETASVTRSCQGCKELIGAANRYIINFSENLTVQQKLIILGSSFLIDLNYFEKQNKCW